VEEYAVLAQAARWLSGDEWDRTANPELGGGIDAHLADAVREAARTIAVIAWSPTLVHKWRWRRAKKRINELLTRLQSEETTNAVQRSRANGFV
jgi:hypothetical protein